MNVNSQLAVQCPGTDPLLHSDMFRITPSVVNIHCDTSTFDFAAASDVSADSHCLETGERCISDASSSNCQGFGVLLSALIAFGKLNNLVNNSCFGTATHHNHQKYKGNPLKQHSFQTSIERSLKNH